MENVENARNKYKKSIITPIIIGLIISLFLLAIIITTFIISKKVDTEGISLITMIIMFTIIGEAIALYLSTKNTHKEYKKAYKAYFVEGSLKRIFTNIVYFHETGMPKYALDQTGMINTGDRYSSNDFVEAKYKEVVFSQADVKIEEEHEDADDNSYYTTIFKGRWLEFEFPKKFNFKLEVVQRWFPAKRVPKGNNGKKLNRIEIESTTFNKKFKTYAEDGFEAFYILDPTLIEQIENLTKNHKGKYLLCFVDNKLSVAIHDGKDAFEPPSPFWKIDEKKELEKVIGDIRLITGFVDYLRLDHKLFQE